MPEVVGLLLAGGQSRRMGGGDKSLMKVGGETLLARIVARVKPQVGPIVLNANGDPARFASFGLPIAPDVIEGYAGPLAGVLTGLEWARANAPHCAYVASFASDAPFLPRDLVARLLAAREAAAADLACAASGGRDHPVFGLWPAALAEALRRAVVDEGIRKVDEWTGRYKLARAEYSTDPVDPFFNLNAPEDFAAAEAFVSAAARP
jgi:molybdopterin-guanine dinucleotide biosynthesis protein A